ncbi:hypothetical protein R6Q59_033980, partial [Mikania micrantha]
AGSDKVAKHEKTCLENQHVFTLFAFDTFGFLVPEAVNFPNRVHRFMNSNITAPMTQNVVFSRIDFAIQKRVAVVARLPVSERCPESHKGHCLLDHEGTTSWILKRALPLGPCKGARPPLLPLSLKLRNLKRASTPRL